MRSVKNPTPTGMRIRISARQMRPNPTDGDKLASLNVPWPAAVSVPNKQRNSPGQPQSTTVAIVAIMPVFLLFMSVFSNEMNLSEYTFHEQQVQGFGKVLRLSIYPNFLSGR